jgi:hypothetical protein
LGGSTYFSNKSNKKVPLDPCFFNNHYSETSVGVPPLF